MRPALRGRRGSAPGVPRNRGGASDALSSAVALASELRAPGAGALSEAETFDKLHLKTKEQREDSDGRNGR